MKYLFYLLALANAVFFIWETGFRQNGNSEGVSRELTIPGNAERIVLATEVADLQGLASEPADAGVTVQPKTPAVDPSAEAESLLPGLKPQDEAPDCFQIGPAPTQEEANDLLDLVKSHAAEASIVEKSGDVAEGWWVLFPKAESLETARQNQRMLMEKGVKDAWLFDKGPLKGAISLGLYKTREEAEAARQPFKDKNIVTEITPRLVRGQVYWLKIPWHRSALELEEIVQVLNSQDSTLHVPVPIPCD